MAACALFQYGVAQADMVPGSAFEAAGWDGAARTRATGEFAYCVIRHSYPNGVELSLARSPEGLFFIGLKNPAWALKKGGEVRAQVAIDDAAGRSESAIVVSSDTVLFTFWPHDAAAYSDLLSAGSRLTVADLSVTPQSTAWEFDLAGTHEALDALRRCVAERNTSATASARKPGF